MPTTDPRIDAYIAKSADFAKAILTHVRALVHEACPDVVETMKWGNPSFDHQGLLCSMGAFKTHCTVGFWKGELLGLTREEGSMGHFGRITSMTDLPAKSTFVKLVKQAAKLNEAGVKVAQPARIPRAELPVPNDLMGALKKNKKAMTAFQSFPPSHRREYIEWITEAKREETRQKRLTVATLVRKELPQIAPSAIVDSVATLDGMVARVIAPWRSTSLLLSALGAVAFSSRASA